MVKEVKEMSLKRKNIAITALTAALLTSGILATANAATGTYSGTVTVYRDSTTNVNVATEKTTASGSDAKITFGSAISANDRLVVYIKNQNDNVVSYTGSFYNISAGKPQSLSYMPNKGKKGNSFYPCFSLNSSSMSTSITTSYTFQP